MTPARTICTHQYYDNGSGAVTTKCVKCGFDPNPMTPTLTIRERLLALAVLSPDDIVLHEAAAYIDALEARVRELGTPMTDNAAIDRLLHPTSSTYYGSAQMDRDIAAVCNELVRLRTSTARVFEEWRPIETAPKDGRGVLYGHYRDGKFGWIVSGFCHANGRHMHDADDANAFPEQPTHWQPLPAPPRALPSPTGRGKE